MPITTRAPRRKFVPTAEQAQKTVERRARFKELAKAVSAMNDDQRAGIIARFGAVVTCQGGTLSPFNSCLLISQFESVSMVGGFNQWKLSGRKVRKGANGLMLWVPTGKKSAESDGAPVEISADGESESKGGKCSFIMGTVFDITQTEPIDESTAEVLDELE